MNNYQKMIDEITDIVCIAMIPYGLTDRGEGRLNTALRRQIPDNECRKYDCKEPCEKYKKLRMSYIRKGRIMIQPFGTRMCDQGNKLRIQYDLLSHKYIPSKNHGEYSEEELEIIEGHIKQFGLNTPERKNYEIGRYCKNVISSESLMKGVEYNNLIVNLFREKLADLDMTKVVKICMVVYNNSFQQLAT